MRIIVAAIHGLVLGVSTGFAQNPSPDSLLTWPDCVQLALRNNPELASSNYALEASKSAYYGSRNGLYPQLSLDQSYHVPGSAPNSSHWQTQGSVNLNVLDMSEVANIKTAKTFIAQAQANQRQTSSLLRFNLRQAFAQLAFVQKNIEVSRKIVAMRQEESQLVSLRYNSGRESKGNMLRAKAQLLQAQADLAQALRDLRSDQKNLNRQIGLEGFSAFKADDNLEVPPPSEPPKDENELSDHRPEVIRQQALVNTAAAGLDQARSSHWPSLTAGYSEFLYGASSLQSGWNLLLSYPLFGKGPTSAHYAILTAKSNLERAKQDLRAAREQAIVDIETSWSDYAGAFEQSGVQNALLEAARQRNEEANIRYNSGLMTYDNWEIIASERIDLERQAIQGQLHVVIAEAAWQKTLGKQLEE